MINIIVAIDQNRVIGHENQLPWHLPADLRHFKNLTMGHVIIMGRKTYDSIGKALPGRTNIIITRNPVFKASDAKIYHNIQIAFQDYAQAPEIFIIGGAQLFEETFSLTQRLYVTKIHAAFKGDTYFPAYDEKTWQMTQQQSFKPDQKNKYSYEFLTLTRLTQNTGTL